MLLLAATNIQKKLFQFLPPTNNTTQKKMQKKFKVMREWRTTSLAVPTTDNRQRIPTM